MHKTGAGAALQTLRGRAQRESDAGGEGAAQREKAVPGEGLAGPRLETSTVYQTQGQAVLGGRRAGRPGAALVCLGCSSRPAEAHTCARTHTHTHTCTHTRVRAHTHTQRGTHPYVRAGTRTQPQTHTHARAHACARTYSVQLVHLLEEMGERRDPARHQPCPL